MKKQISIISAAILLGSLLLLSGCNKNEFGQAGKLVRFGARSEGVSTRTEYGGKDNDASGIEPIWWKSGDQVRIVSDKAVVTGTTNNYSDYQFAVFSRKVMFFIGSRIARISFPLVGAQLPF